MNITYSNIAVRRSAYAVALFFSFAVFLHSTAFSQTNDCGNNAGFETGNTAGWVCKYGYYGGGLCPTPADSAICPTFNTVIDTIGCKNANGINAPLNTGVDRHTIITSAAYGTGFDPNTGSGPPVPVVPPGSGNYVFRLGDGVTGGAGNSPKPYARAESLSLSFNVSAGTPVFTYRYAAFIYDAGHWAEEQPRFEILFKTANDSIIPNGYYKVIAGNYNPHCPGFEPSKWHQGNLSWRYTDWISADVDLSAYIGQAITIEFRTSDCFPGNSSPALNCPPSGCCTTTINGVSCDCNGVCTGTPSCNYQAGNHSAYVYLDAFCQTATGVKDVTAADGIKVYPNPAGDRLTVYGLQFTVAASVELYNILGRKVMERKWQTENGKLEVDISDLADGVYFLKVRDGNGGTESIRKIVVQ